MTNLFPAYNLKAVIIETGIKADVLRAWERRYDLPKPQRTPGGHRLYSEYDIEIVKWLRSRQAEGLNISRAVELWKEMVDEGLDPLEEYQPASTPLAPALLTAADARIEVLRQNWVEAVLSFDSIKADEVLNHAFAIYPVETVCTEILQQGISDIGNYWYLDKAYVQQEHFASAQASRRLEILIAATPRPTRKQTVMIGCPSGEQHTFPVLLVSLLLSRRGLKVVYLGADIPVERLVETAAVIHPDLIILAAQQLTTAAALQAAFLSLQGSGISLAYGGLIFNRAPGLRERIPAHFLGETMDGAMSQAERLLTAPVPLPSGIELPETYRALAGLFRENRPLIDLAVVKKLQTTDLPNKYISEANSFFGSGMTAALEFGDPGFLEADLEWVQRLLTGRQISAERLIEYLSVYSQVTREALGSVGAPITDWIDSYVVRNEITRE